MNPERRKYSLSDVVDVSGPQFALRTYYEHRDLRMVLQDISLKVQLQQVCEIGSGFGRMTVVLTEFCANVDGYEREPELIEIARKLIPQVRFVQTESLTRIPVPAETYDFLFTFTVLQHLVEEELAEVASEIKRIVKSGGYVLLCEESDGNLLAGDPHDRNAYPTIGRSVDTYQSLMDPLKLIQAFPRKVEPSYPRSNVGTYMLYRQ